MEYNPLTKVTCRTCIHCRKSAELVLPTPQVEAWKAGARVQDAFPNLDVDTRELLITGTHPACWDEMFGDEDDEEEA